LDGWLGALADYDERKHTEMLKNLTQYLQHGSYEARPPAHVSSVEYGCHWLYDSVGARLPVACGLVWAAKIGPRRPACHRNLRAGTGHGGRG
jgi:hypothetical protein